MAAPCVCLTYFDGRGRAEALRWVLAQAGAKYTDKRLNGDEWAAMKPKTLTGALPVLCVDGVDIAESGAIFQYLAAEYGLNGCNKVESALVQMVWCQLDDFMNTVYDTVMAKDETKKAEACKKLEEQGPKFMQFLKCRLSGGKQWLVNDKMTAADLAVACRLSDVKGLKDVNDHIGRCMKDCSEVEALVKRVHALPNIKKWVETRPVTKM